MSNDFLKVKKYSAVVTDKTLSEPNYILSFDDNHHIKVSALTKRIIDCFDGTKNINEIVDELKREKIDFQHKDVEKFITQILIKNAMLEGTSYQKLKKTKKNLWIHIPIVESKKFKRLYNILKIFYNKYIMVLTTIIIIVCIIYNLISCFRLGGIRLDIDNINSLKLICICYLSLIIHELGHVTAAAKYNIEVGYIGIGMYLFNPVMYVDMTNTWRLKKKERMIVDIGGMYFQSITTIPLTIISLFNNNYMLRLSLVMIIYLTVVNLIPFIKLDGYWLLSDALDLVNVSENALINMKKLFLQLFKVHKYNIAYTDIKNYKKQVIYYIYGFVYVIATIFMLLSGGWIVIKLLINYNLVIKYLYLIYKSILDGNILCTLQYINNTLILILPLLFLIYFVCSFMKGFIKGVLRKLFAKN